MSDFWFWLFFCFRFKVFLPNGTFDVGTYISTGWIHVVVNYIGLNNGEGTRMFIDSVEVSSATTKDTGLHSPGDERIVVGRWYKDKDDKYASVQIDELIFFNNLLSSEEVHLLYSAVKKCF